MHPWSEKKDEASGQRSDCIEQKEDNGSFSFRQRVQKVIFFDANSNGFISKNVVPAEGGEHFSKNVSENYKKERA